MVPLKTIGQARPTSLFLMGAFIFLLPPSSFGEVFKCINDRRISYSSTPCASGAVAYNSVAASVVDSSPDSVTTVRGADGLFYLKGAINGVSTDFIVDTGASYTAISGDFAKKLGINNCLPVGVSKTAGGDTAVCSVSVSSLSVGGFKFSQVSIALIPAMRGTVLLGSDLLSRFRITQQSGVMVLSK